MTSVTPFHSSGCALIVGINDYRTFDPTGQHDLKGGAHDTVAVARCAEVLGMAAEDIHIVRDDVKSAGNAFVLEARGDTTQKGIYAEIDWLRAQLDAGRKGLLWYSGHGAHTNDKGLLLCPSDTRADFSNAIPIRELAARLGPKALENLTLVLDCCHGGPPIDALGRPSKTLGGDPIAPGSRDDDLNIGAVVLAACGPGEQAQQSWFAALPHGAFTWALLSAANQWQAQQQGGNVRLTLTYDMLLERAGSLLQTLEFSQRARLYGPAGVKVGKLAALQLGADALGTSAEPNANRRHIQLDPTEFGCEYELQFEGIDLSIVTFAAGPAASSSQGLFNASTEYWSVPEGMNLDKATGLTIRASENTAPSGSTNVSAATAVNMPTTMPSTTVTGSPPEARPGMFYYQGDGAACAVDFAALPGEVTWWFSGETSSYLISTSDTSTLSWSATPPEGFPFEDTFTELALTSYAVPQPSRAWLFRDGTGPSTTAAPAVGTTSGTLGRSATMVGNAAWVTVNPTSDDDTEAYVDFGGSVASFGTADFTISFWYQTSDSPAHLGDVLGNRVVPEYGDYLSLRMAPSGTLSLELCDNNSSATYHQVSSGVTVNSGNTWHHIAITRTSSAVSLYVDGTEWSQSTEQANNLTSTVSFKAGRSLPSNPGSFTSIQGEYADLRIYPGTALSAAQLQQIALSAPTV